MSVAQALYENGHITYMRTDSPTLSQQALDAARTQARQAVRRRRRSPRSRALYAGKSKNAQEAHEAIRPSGDTFKTPGELQARELAATSCKLYDLIWKRTVASQMNGRARIHLDRSPSRRDGDPRREFSASGTVITFRGFLSAYEESHDEERNAGRPGRVAPAEPHRGPGAQRCCELEAKGHETSPPPRYTEASLVKALEELGIGRPSTYATIISTIIDRGYVTPRGQALVPQLDRVQRRPAARGVLRRPRRVRLHRRYGGRPRPDRRRRGEPGRLAHRLLLRQRDQPAACGASSTTSARSTPAEINSIKIADDLTLRIGKYGPYLEAPAEEGRPRAASTCRRTSPPMN